jgi:hypothetical protein
MLISPKYTAEDWTGADRTTEAGWMLSVDILEDRINGRFIDFIDQILPNEYSGFVVLGLDALLIETLQQFHDGELQTEDGMGAAKFAEFLTKTAFAPDFTKRTARRFYKEIRCGILHQAEVKGLTRIRRDGKRMVETTGNGGLTINPVMFHERLKAVFATYCLGLRNPQNTHLRTMMVKKMDGICKVRLNRADTFDREVP